MKRFAALFILLLTLAAAASANEGVTIEYNGETLSSAGIIRSDYTLVPFRGVMERIGASVMWDEKNRTAIAVRGETSVETVIGSNDANVNNELMPMDTPAALINDRTYIPLRFFVESMGVDVEWDESGRRVILTDTRDFYESLEFCDITGSTLYNYADSRGMTVDEVKEKYSLPRSLKPGDSDAAIMYLMPYGMYLTEAGYPENYLDILKERGDAPVYVDETMPYYVVEGERSIASVCHVDAGSEDAFRKWYGVDLPLWAKYKYVRRQIEG